MSDRHVKILAMAARRSKRQLETHDARGLSDVVSAQQRVDLRLRAVRTHARLVAARARRHQGSGEPLGAESAAAEMM